MLDRSTQAPNASSPRTTLTRGRPVLDRVCVAAFTAAWLGALAHHAPHLARGELWVVGPLALLAGYLGADLLAGTVHWLADRFFDPGTPVLGPLLIAPFREHHQDATLISHHDFFEVSANNALVCAPATLALLWLPIAQGPGTTAGIVFGLSLSLALFATNQLHGWAHAARPPRIARWLQRRGLILTPERHAIHHRAGHDRAYCVTSGWLNPLLDRLRLFDRLERLVATATPHRRRMT